VTRVACLFIKCLECKYRSRSSTDLEGPLKVSKTLINQSVYFLGLLHLFCASIHVKKDVSLAKTLLNTQKIKF